MTMCTMRAAFARCVPVLMLMMAGASTSADAQRTAEAARPRLLFLLVGQSNMAGRGTVEAQDTVAPARVWSYSQAGTWVPAREPLHFDKPKVVGVGPGRTFGIAIADAWPTVEIGLIPAAVGGSSIRAWAPGAADSATRTHPYDDAIARARAALASGTLAGILWLQGESDGNARNSADYATRLRAVIANMRRDLNAPEVPFLIGQMGRFAERPWTAYRIRVDSMHRAVAATTPRSAFVVTEGLRHRGDTIHYDTESVREIGRRFARQFLTLQPSPPPR